MTYVATVLADAPLHYWRCADSGGILMQDIGSATRMPLAVQAFGSMPYTGPSSDGGSAYLTTISHGGNNRLGVVIPAAAFTMEMWAFLADTQADNILEQLHSAAKLLQLDVDSTGKTTLAAHGTPANANCTDPGTVPFSAWHHYVGTYDGANLRLYIDATLKQTTAYTSNVADSYGEYLGQNSAGASCTVAVAEVAIYNTTLSGARVNAHFAAADQAAQFPVWKGLGGGFVSSTGGGTVSANDLATVLNSVRKTY